MHSLKRSPHTLPSRSLALVRRGRPSLKSAALAASEQLPSEQAVPADQEPMAQPDTHRPWLFRTGKNCDAFFRA